MRVASICVIIILAASAINAIRGLAGQFPLPQVLPGCGGSERPMLYQLGGIAMFGLLLWGLGRVSRLGEDDE